MDGDFTIRTFLKNGPEKTANVKNYGFAVYHTLKHRKHAMVYLSLRLLRKEDFSHSFVTSSLLPKLFYVPKELVN